jgi:hypothetical protein
MAKVPFTPRFGKPHPDEDGGQDRNAHQRRQPREPGTNSENYQHCDAESRSDQATEDAQMFQGQVLRDDAVQFVVRNGRRRKCRD